jgi:hypothetical protein
MYAPAPKAMWAPKMETPVAAENAPAATAPATSATSSLPAGKTAPRASNPKTAYAPWFATAEVKLDETLAMSIGRVY